MQPSAVAAVRHVIDEYRRFLKTSYRFLDDRLREQFERHLSEIGVVVKGPYVTLSRDFERNRTLKQMAESGDAEADLLKARWPFEDKKLYFHQEQAFLTGGARRPFVVTTGTGSGKTEAFLLPVMDGIIRRKCEGVRGLQAVFLYPMNALANDQLERLRRLLRGTGLNISFALYTRDSDTASHNLREKPAETERLTRAEIRNNPPDILLTNYKQLEFLLVREQDRKLFTHSLCYLVLDEIHAYRGALATEIAALIRRLKAHSGIEAGDFIGIGTSATVAAGNDGMQALADFAKTLFGTPFQTEDIISERLVPLDHVADPWTPSLPPADKTDLTQIDFEDTKAVIELAELLSG